MALRDEYIKATLAPDFWTSRELKATIPGDNLYVEVYDWDHPDPDDLIGITTIDLENRIFSEDWQSYNAKPLEHRTLWVDNSSFPQVCLLCFFFSPVLLLMMLQQQGRLELAIDILPIEVARNTPFLQLRKPEVRKHQVRVIIWNTSDVVFKDAVALTVLPFQCFWCRAFVFLTLLLSNVQDMSDQIIVGTSLWDNHKEKTDTNWRCVCHLSFNCCFRYTQQFVF